MHRICLLTFLISTNILFTSGLPGPLNSSNSSDQTIGEDLPRPANTDVKLVRIFEPRIPLQKLSIFMASLSGMYEASFWSPQRLDSQPHTATELYGDGTKIDTTPYPEFRHLVVVADRIWTYESIITKLSAVPDRIPAYSFSFVLRGAPWLQGSMTRDQEQRVQGLNQSSSGVMNASNLVDHEAEIKFIDSARDINPWQLFKLAVKVMKNIAISNSEAETPKTVVYQLDVGDEHIQISFEDLGMTKPLTYRAIGSGVLEILRFMRSQKRWAEANAVFYLTETFAINPYARARIRFVSVMPINGASSRNQTNFAATASVDMEVAK